MGPCVGMGDPFWLGLDCADIEILGLNGVMLCDTPSASMNCSRNSMFVRPLAIILHVIFVFMGGIVRVVIRNG